MANAMKFSEQLTDQQKADLRYLRGYYRWSDDDAREIKLSLDERGEEAMGYYTALANAHREGYVQNEQNGFMRLDVWCAENGMPSPYLSTVREPA
jgi:hypothetical protein